MSQVKKVRSLKAKVIIPRTDADLEELKRLDKEGKLASGKSYPKSAKKPEPSDDLKAIADLQDQIEKSLNKR